MAINEIQLGAAAGDGNGDGLREGGEIINANFTAPENAASKIVQASSADTTSNKVMLSDYAWRGAQLGDYFTYGGTANAITLTSANLKAGGTLIAGMKFRFKATASNTGATTITVDGGSTINCVTPTGVALPADFIRTDVITECEYDGANFVVSRKVESGSDAGRDWMLFENGDVSIYIESEQSMTATSEIDITYSFPFELVNIPYINHSIADIRSSVIGSSNFDIISAFGESLPSNTGGRFRLAAIDGNTFSASGTLKVTTTAKGKWY